jgi:hypothetical protein
MNNLECDVNIDTVEGFMQTTVCVSELCRYTCVCASVIQATHTTMSVTRMKTFVNFPNCNLCRL